MRFYAHHGVMAQERAVGNWFEVSVLLTYNLADAPVPAETDTLESTINYARVAEIVAREMAIPSQLLETVALRIRRALLADAAAGSCADGAPASVASGWPVIIAGSIRVAKLTPPLGLPMAAAAATLRW